MAPLMLPLPKAVVTEYLGLLRYKNIHVGYHSEYLKWLRYYLDFCAKYVITLDQSERLTQFIEKLRQKNQTEGQCKRAADAISLYFELQSRDASSFLPMDKVKQLPAAIDKPLSEGQSKVYLRKSQYVEAGYLEKTDSPAWDAVLDAMAAEIKFRHYSRKTLKTYGKWSRCFQRFLKNKPPEDVATEDVKEYLTYLAIKCNVAASTQNQA